MRKRVKGNKSKVFQEDDYPSSITSSGYNLHNHAEHF